MDIFENLDDDFPCVTSSSVEPHKYYEAFKKAEDILGSAPRKIRENGENSLSELTSHLYKGGEAATALYRKRENASDVLTGIWLAGVRKTSGWYVAANQIKAFQGLDKEILFELPRRFKNPKDLRDIGPYLAQYGIAFIWEDALPAMKLDGAVFLTSNENLVVALSLRYARLDYFWFTLMHELAHAVLHSAQLETPIVDNLEEMPEDIVEKQADRLAMDSLIPRNEWRSCAARYTNSAKDVVDFADRLGIPAQCVAGRLRREMHRYDIFAEIINKYDVREILNEK